MSAIATPGAVELHRVTCPYCLVGYAQIQVKVIPGQQTKHIEGINDAWRCQTCKRYFRLKPTVQIVGVRMEDTPHGR